MTIVSFADPAPVKPGYLLQMPQGLALADTAGAPVEFCKFSLAPGASTVADAHEEHEIWFIVSGAGELLLDGERLSVAAGTTVYFQPQSSHTLFNTGAGELNVISVYWGATEEGEQ